MHPFRGGGRRRHYGRLVDRGRAAVDRGRGAADKDYVALEAGVALPDDLRTNPYYFAYWGYANHALQVTILHR